MKEPQFAAKKNILSVTHDSYKFSYDMETGLFGLAPDSGASAIASAAASATFFSSGNKNEISSARAAKRSHKTGKTEDGISLTIKNEFATGPALTQQFFFSSGVEYILANASLEVPAGATSIEADSIKPVDIAEGSAFKVGPSTDSWSIYNLGYQSWSPAETNRAGQKQQRPNLKIAHIQTYNPLRYPPKIRGRRLCEWLAVIKNLDTSDSLLCGFVTTADMFSHIYLEIDTRAKTLKKLQAHCCADRAPIAPGAAMHSELLCLRFTREPLAAMDDYAELLGKKMNARIPEEIPVGWCSWYKYFTKIEQSEMMSNLKALQKLSADIPIKFFQIDDGYQSAVGDWKTLRGNRFPDGMGFLAKESRKAGFEPGIWVAPFFARKNSRIYREHRDWFLKDEKGAPVSGGFNPLWGGALSPLDLTHPETQDWLRDTFKTIVHEWGYKYLKLDFLYSACVLGKFHTPGMTRAQAYRRGLEIIRETAGDGVFILGCGAPIGPSVGMFEAMRIGTDVGPKWREPLLRAFLGSRTEPSVESSLINCLTRSFLHNRIWANDPDCILLRKGKLTRDEYLTFSTIIGLTGGMLLISDNMNELDEEGRHIFGQLVPPTGIPATPIDLFENAYPSVYCLKIPGRDTIRLAATLNWKDSPAGAGIDFAELGLKPDTAHHVFSYWEERYLGEITAGLNFPELPAHGCKYLVIKQTTGEPAVLATNLHIGAGAIEIKKELFDKEKNRLEIAVELAGRRNGKIFFHAPSGFSPVSAKQDGSSDLKIAEYAECVFAIDAVFTDAANFEISFTRK